MKHSQRSRSRSRSRSKSKIRRSKNKRMEIGRRKIMKTKDKIRRRNKS